MRNKNAASKPAASSVFGYLSAQIPLTHPAAGQLSEAGWPCARVAELVDAGDLASPGIP